MDKNKAGTKFNNWLKHNDFTHRQIDNRSERKERETEDRNPIEVNDTGRVWRF